jgi:hypothetical protein
VQQQKERSNQRGFSVNLAAVLAMMLYMPLRCRYGRHHLGLWPLVGMFIVFIWAGVSNCHYLLWLIPINGLVWFGEAFAVIARRCKGIKEHTRYNGHPFATYWLFGDEGFCKLVAEPLISIGIGYLFYRFSDQPNAATLFWWGAFAMFMVQSSINEKHQRIIEEVGNTRIEQQYVMSEMQRRR